MMTTQHLLFELGSEELPPKTLLRLSNALLNNITQGLTAAGLSFGSSKAYATPRRLAVVIENVVTAQADTSVEKRGPAIQAAFMPDGSPSKAALGFAVSCGTTFEQLHRLKTDKGEWLSFTQQEKGQATPVLLPAIIQQSVANLPIAKRMRWGDSSIEFVRPVHWAVLLYGNETIKTDVLGLTTGNTTRGHRFHAPQALVIDAPEHYVAILRQQGKVIADIEQRKAIIKAAGTKAAADVGGIAHIEADLLEEIAALNEWPVPVTGHYDARFLALPAEVLITTMQTNQKYFPVKNAEGKLLPHFITFSNIESSNPLSIQQGNERVITPRLSDAEFFWKQDRKQSLADRVASLESIVFQQQLGTLADKTHRVTALSGHIAALLQEDVSLAQRAATLAKTDLMTNMVGEFGNLQGIMGRYYAIADNELPEVALALEEQYFPKQSGGITPSTRTGQILAVAEKLDTLTGIFSAGLIPTGDKDPYALRRATIGLLRIIIEKQLNLNIIELVDIALNAQTHVFDAAIIRPLLLDFIYDRLKGYCLDQGYAADEFEAVMSVKPAEPLDFMQRLKAVKAFRQLPEAISLAATNKRISNILKKSPTQPAEKVGVLVESAEQALLQAALQSAEDIQPLLAQRDYPAALNRLAQLRSTVDAFFDQVMVNTDDLELRASRLALLAMLAEQFLHIADISKLQA
ncbi:MAG: glycine--tRNA ligase subunit beta [Methylococcaceae bacterium]